MNKEHYIDPTADTAVKNTMRDFYKKLAMNIKKSPKVGKKITFRRQRR